jgi:hypothetical protein
MAALTSQPVGMTGAAVTFTAAASGDFYIPVDGDRSWLWIKNGSGSSITLGVSVGGTTYGQNNTDISIVIGAGAERMVGPLVIDLVGSDTLGAILFSYSATASVTVAVARLETAAANPFLS